MEVRLLKSLIERGATLRNSGLTRSMNSATSQRPTIRGTV